MDIYVEVKVKGEQLGYRFGHVRITCDVFKPCAIELEILFQRSDAKRIYATALDTWLGETLDICILDRVRPSVQANYKGIVTSLDMKQDSLMLFASSEDAMLGWTQRSCSFTDLDGNSIVKRILEPLASKKIVPAPKSVAYKFFQQNNETDTELLARIARYDGCLFYHNGDEFIYDSAMKGETLITLGLENISDISMECRLVATKAEGYPYNFTRHTEPADFRTQSTPYTPPAHALFNKVYDKSKKFAALRELYHETLVNKNDFEPFLSYSQASEAGQMALVKGKTNLPTVKLGCTIQCEQTPLLSEPVVVTQLHVLFANNEYHALFGAVAKGAYLTPPVRNDSATHGFPQHAVVVENKDPDKLGRVQIQYKWKVGYGDKARNPWARIVHTGAGSDKDVQYGTHYIPRVGDHVLVACENGDPSQPVILGALYHSESKPDVKTENGTEEVLVVRTPRQSTVRVLDKSGDEEIVISMKDNKNLIRLELKQPKITIESVDGDILVHAKNITVNADETITMNAKNIVANTKENITTVAGQHQKHSAKANYTKEVAGNNEEKIKGNSKVSVGGNHEETASGNRKVAASANVDVNAGAEAKVSGGAKATIQSAMVESSASATNTIKGAMVMIN